MIIERDIIERGPGRIYCSPAFSPTRVRIASTPLLHTEDQLAFR